MMEVVKSGDFEATLSWGVGVRGHPLFHVFTLTSPPRVVIEIGPNPSGAPWVQEGATLAAMAVSQ